MIGFRDKMRKKWRSVIRAAETQLSTNDEFLSGQKKSRLQKRCTIVKDFLLDAFFAFPDPQCCWLKPAVRELAHLPRDERPDVIFATGGPWTSLLVGKKLAREYGIPFVVDFRDPWTRNAYKRPLSPALLRRSKILERTVCETAARVITNTTELHTQFAADYPDLQEKFLTITNGFDDDANSLAVAWPPDRECIQSLPHGGPTVQICHFGTIYGNRNPFRLLQAIKELLEENEVTGGHLRVRFVGAWEVEDSQCESVARELEDRGILRREPPIPHEVCLQQMAKAPVLLILQPSSPLQIPAKIFEYIATGRPLLVIGGEGATANLVERHQLGLCCQNQQVAIKNLLRELIDHKTVIRPPSVTAKMGFSYRTLAGELAEVLEAAYLKRQR